MVQADDFGEVQQETRVKGNDPKVAGNLREGARNFGVMMCHPGAEKASEVISEPRTP